MDGIMAEEVKIVNESYIADCTGGLQPGVEAENPAEATHTAAEWRDGTGVKKVCCGPRGSQEVW